MEEIAVWEKIAAGGGVGLLILGYIARSLWARLTEVQNQQREDQLNVYTEMKALIRECTETHASNTAATREMCELLRDLTSSERPKLKAVP